MALAFVPLFYAVSTYAKLSLQQAREASALALGRAVAGHVAEARRERAPEALFDVLQAEIGAEGVAAIGVYDRAGTPLVRSGDAALVAAFAQPVDAAREAVLELPAESGRAMVVRVPDPRGVVAVAVRVDDQAARATPLVRLVGLYTGVFALALLVLAYFALTRLIVQPLDRLARAAERVARGARAYDAPRTGARELDELGASLRTMTERLLENEEALRRQIAEVQRTTDELRAAQAGLVRSERLASVGRLAAGLGHEIGNPIAALLGMQELLLDGGSSEGEQRDFLLRMKRETERISRILSDLLAFARAGAASTASAQPGSVEVAVHDVAALAGLHRAMRDVDLAIDVAPGLPAVALGAEPLVQVLLNLVLNAADAVGARGGRVTVRARPAGDGVELAVEDDGPGVAPEVADTLFEPFVSTKEVGKGTGLGLAVCRGLVEAAGGKIRLDTEHEAGARFVVELPRFPG
ncbi:MAG: HAMP domain-containing protein [Polyangiaceae bacterium]|nr:HAMP domain-containing protein [Polyangiaceae bacterium]